jgi:hypothetical protein
VGIDKLAQAPKRDVSVVAHTKSLAPEAKRVARGYVEGFYAARAGDVSAKWIAAQEQAGERIQQDHAEHLVDGYDAVVRALAQTIPRGAIKTSHVVHAVDWRPGEVRVTLADGRTFEGGRLEGRRPRRRACRRRGVVFFSEHRQDLARRARAPPHRLRLP